MLCQCSLCRGHTSYVAVCMEENLWLQTQTDGHHPQHTQRQLPTPLVERELSVLERRRGPILGGRTIENTIRQDFLIVTPMYLAFM